MILFYSIFASARASPPSARSAADGAGAAGGAPPRPPRSGGAAAAPPRRAWAEGAGAEAEGAGSGLLGRYFGGMLKEPLVDKSPRTEGKNRLDPNLRLGAQATVVLGLLFLGFMAANGLL